MKLKQNLLADFAFWGCLALLSSTVTASVLPAPQAAVNARLNGEGLVLHERARVENLDAPLSIEEITAAVVGLFFVWAIANAIVTSPSASFIGSFRRFGRHRARHLYLPLKFRGNSEQDARLLELSEKRAVMISKASIEPQSRVVFHLGSLPQYPEANDELAGTIIASTKLSHADGYLLKASLCPSSASQRTRLDRFIESLIGPWSKGVP